MFATAIHVALLLNRPVSNFPSVDEVAHLPSAVAHWKFEKFDMYRVNPPLTRMLCGIPALIEDTPYEWSLYSEDVGERPEFRIGVQRLSTAKISIYSEFVEPRLISITFSIVGAGTILYAVSRFVSNFAGYAACVWWYTSPNILAHTPSLVPDVAAASLGAIAAIAFFAYAKSPTVTGSLNAGFAFGLACLCKLTWVTGFVTFPLAVAFCTMLRLVPSRSLFGRFADLQVFWITALFILNAGYFFEGTFTKVGEYQFCSEFLGGEGSNSEIHGNRFRGTFVESIPLPLPRNYLLGIDYLKFEVEDKKRSFLMGEWRLGSWPHYYLMTTLFKTPEPTLIAAIIGGITLLLGMQRRIVHPHLVAMFIMLGFPAGVCFASVSLQGGFNHHHRYVLMIYPFLFVLAACVASPTAMQVLRFQLPFKSGRKLSIAVPLSVSLVALSAASSLRVHPHYTSYFNTISGGPENGWRLLGFSNIDWGQDIREVDKWLKDNPNKRPIVMDLDYFGLNGRLFDIASVEPPALRRNASIDEVRRSVDETQWWIISVKKLYNLPGYDGLEYLQQIEPVDRIAYAYHVYRIDPLPSGQDY